jgi:hypothetical protein
MLPVKDLLCDKKEVIRFLEKKNLGRFFFIVACKSSKCLNLLDESKRNGLRDFASTKRECEDVFKKKKIVKEYK